MYGWMDECIYVRMYLCIYVCIYVCACECMYAAEALDAVASLLAADRGKRQRRTEFPS